ncbi:alpha/beta hydrolase [Streptomyces viridiviolaceus]|uniref:Alpha/beta fold hydrolase n=1 Tax=Streptomyces viridiviolaceus TaxID=68282 RepID=A0ABW2E745_9ACTN|nr:alpha/beta hydrolase [Streptomyces viridiviolaceus]GHB47045.1 alpha/beta hydrolase [Streptomyces viridiviolaceus]
MNSPISRRTVTASLLAGAAALGTGAAFSAPATAADRSHRPHAHPDEPTVVLIHGAFADASSWSGVVERLQRHGHRVLAPALPLRGLAGDAAYIRSVLDSVTGPIVLVGHSYGGAVISQAAANASHVKALVYIAAFVPEVGESALHLTDKFPGSTLGQATVTQYYPLPGGGQGEELVIKKDLFRRQFADGVPVSTAQVMAAGQRPITVAALQEPATAAAWKKIPSWYLVATEDRNIPPAAERWMAKRARAHTVTVRAPHAVSVSNPGPVTDLILRASRSVRSGH